MVIDNEVLFENNTSTMTVYIAASDRKNDLYGTFSFFLWPLGVLFNLQYMICLIFYAVISDYPNCKLLIDTLYYILHHTFSTSIF